ncbi:MAG: DUF4249 domain-containing protein [Bacteroidales bacterium]|nr:DUF4249 domain-containing protein [Bacteroidales bacterium]
MKKIARILLPLILLCSCSAGDPWEVADQEIVVDGWIDAGAPPIVIVTSTVTPSSELQSVDKLQDHVLKWAKVSLTTPDTTVVLIGRQDKNYFPPYVFTSGYVLGKPGQKYDLKVEYSGKTVTASAVVPEKEALQGIEARPVAGSDSLYTLVVKMGPKPAERRFYRIFTKVAGEDDCFMPCFPGAYDSDALVDNAEINITKGYGIDGRKLNSHFKKGDRVHIKFSTMDEGAWQYWSDLDRICSLGKAVIFPTFENPSSNISGGLGYWAGYGAQYYSINL